MTRGSCKKSSPMATLTEDALQKHELKTTKGPTELRQFACLPCGIQWWRTVLKSKRVSKCKGIACGGQRYDSLPRNMEFGIGRFLCPNADCKREFYGHCQASEMKKCRKCGTPTQPNIHPKWIKRVKKKRQQRRKLDPNARAFTPPTRQNYDGPQFYPVSAFNAGKSPPLSMEELDRALPSLLPDADTPLFVPPLAPTGSADAPPLSRPPQKRRTFNPSIPHVSSGGTVTTFISQCDFEITGKQVDLDYDDEVDEFAVGACSFQCQCGNEFTVLCRLADTAPCFNCHTSNNPLHWAAPREIEHKTENQHSCSRCTLDGECPNVQEARFAMMD